MVSNSNLTLGNVNKKRVMHSSWYPHSRTLTGWGQLTIETQAYYSHTLLGICR